MRNFIKSITLFIIPLVTIFTTIEVLFRNVPNDYRYKKEYLDSHAPEIKVIILGSSQTFFSVDPRYLSKKSFNGSHVAQSIKYDHFIFNKYRDNFENLETLVITISYFSFVSMLEENINGRRRIKNYVIYYNSDYYKYVPRYHLELVNNKLSFLLESIHRYYKKNVGNQSCSTLGFGLGYSNDTQKNLEKSGIRAAIRQTQLDFHNLSENVRYIKEMIEWCKIKNIRVVLITPPAWHSYTSNLNKTQLEIMEETCSYLQKEYNVEYYSFLFSSKFDKNDYRDASHLNGVGAKKFTNLLNQILMEPQN